MKQNFLVLKRFDRTMILCLASIADPELFSRLHAQHIPDMVYITAGDMDLMYCLIDL
jgi:hypothetical protein